MSKCVGIIPARAGSKGLTQKNSRKIADKHLVEYSIKVAQVASRIDTVVVSTDDPIILKLSDKYPDVVFDPRPEALSQDDSTLIELMEYLCKEKSRICSLEDVSILLQPTSPYRNPEEINQAIARHFETPESAIVAVNKCHQHPFECIMLGRGGGVRKLVDTSQFKGRQEYGSEAYFISGSFYIDSFANLLEYRAYIRQSTKYHITNEIFPVDIDEERDFKLAVALHDYMKATGYSPF